MAHHAFNAFAHLAGRLVGKRQRQNSEGVNAFFNQVGNAVRQDAGFAGPGSGYNHQRAVSMGNCLALRVI